jgi:hypothetical protein
MLKDSDSRSALSGAMALLHTLGSERRAATTDPNFISPVRSPKRKGPERVRKVVCSKCGLGEGSINARLAELSLVHDLRHRQPALPKPPNLPNALSGELGLGPNLVPRSLARYQEGSRTET